MIDDEHYALKIDEAVNAARPSIDLLFGSVASKYNSDALGVILTGGGIDGATGVKAIMVNDGEIIVEDPVSAEGEEMPSAAIAAAITSGIYPLKELAGQIVQRCHPEFGPINSHLPATL